MAEPGKKLGLIGRPLSHSFSKKYFDKKFARLGITEYSYHQFELPNIQALPDLLENTPGLVGLNVTIPYKQEVLTYIDELSPEANTIGAVNVIKIAEGKLLGFNSDYFGFKTSLINWLPENWQGKALVLGTGGASLAVHAVLDDCGIPWVKVSRDTGEDRLSYQQVKDQNLLKDHHLVINTTPLGMYPNIENCPELNYPSMDSQHFLYDLVYNPEITTFMQQGISVGAQVKNGLEMLELQAEKSWEIWTETTR
jgi:shikimate dehydrogenase